MFSMRCPYCGTEVSYQEKFCPSCGAVMPLQPPAPPQQYQYYPPQPPYMRAEPSGCAIASMILGILSLLCSCFCFFSVPLAVVSLPLGLYHRSKYRGNQGMAMAGIVLSIVGLVFSLFYFVMMMMEENYYI